jgi:hypothetical protein
MNARMAIFAVALLLGGCATPNYREKSSMQLCMDYMTLPSANIWQSDRGSELARRGEDCSRYAAAAATQQQADQRMLNALDAAARAAQPPPPPRGPVVCRQMSVGIVCQ